MYDVIGKRRWFFLFSALITLPGLFFILLGPLTGGQAGLQFSIDYTGGSIWEIKFADAGVTPADVKGVLDAQGLTDSTVTATGNGYILIRTEPLGLQTPPPATPAPTLAASASAGPSASGSAASGASGSAGASPSVSGSAAPSRAPQTTPILVSPSPPPSAGASPSASPAAAPVATVAPTPAPSLGPSIPTQGKLGELATALQAAFGPIVDVSQQTTVGPIISSELTGQAIILIILGSIGIVLWMTYRFRDVKFGVTALAALLHDVLVVVGIFAILGTFLGTQIDALFVTAMLTIIGFSVHDTIVVYDRVRENKARHAGEPIASIVNHSILQTFGRSIITSLTVVFTLLALLLFGGAAIRTFVLVLLIGIISGTYSSIFNASPLLVVWEERDQRNRAAAAGRRPSRRPAG